jgi:hypothetical protein
MPGLDGRMMNTVTSTDRHAIDCFVIGARPNDVSIGDGRDLFDKRAKLRQWI